MIKSLVRILIAAYLLAAVLIFVYQRDFIYYPSLKYDHLLTIEQFLNDNEQIEVVVLNEDKEKAILYFGGNGESVVHNSPDFAKAFPQHTIYLVNYRGYAGSSGEASEKALYADAVYIFDRIKNRHESISVVGRSLGSGIATFLASTRAINKLVLVTPFDSIEQIAQDTFPFYPISILLKDKYDSADRIKDVESSTLVILAEHDKVIPLKYSARLIAAFPPHQITVKTILAVGHNDLSNTEEYYFLLKKFI